MHSEVRLRLAEKLLERGIDAYIAYTAPNIFYTTGFRSGYIELTWQMLGTDMALIPADPGITPAILVNDYSVVEANAAKGIDDIRTFKMWTECRDLDVVMGTATDYLGVAKPKMPEQFDHGEIHGIIHDMLAERDLTNAVIGTDLKYMSNTTLEWLRKSNPGCRFVDVSDILYDLRKIKYPSEINILRNSAHLYECGVRHMISDIADGQPISEMRNNYERGILDGMAEKPSLGQYQGSWAYIDAGSLGNTHVATGDIIKPDCGVYLDGYVSDCSRVFSLGNPPDICRKIHDALLAGFQAALELMQPGVRFGDIFDTAQNTVRRNGLPNYSRGHFGHSIGMDTSVEEPPFLGDNNAILEPGMVVCIEVPYYDRKLGGFNIEDMILIKQDGHESFNTLTHELVIL